MAARTTQATRGGKQGRRITNDQISKAEEGGYFIKAAGTGTLSLTGTPKHWIKNPNIVYNLDYRVVGTPEEIRDVLSRSGISEADINQSFTTGNVTQANYQTTMKARYDEEINAATGARAKRKEETQTPAYTLEDLEAIVTQLGIKPGAVGPTKGATVARPAATGTRGKKAGAATGAKSPGRTGPRNSLQARVDALGAGEVIDVSNMKEDGTGAKKGKLTQSQKKARIEGLPIVSDNYANYSRAIDFLLADVNITEAKRQQLEDFRAQFAQQFGQGEKAQIPQVTTASPRTARTATKAAAAPVKRTATKAAAAPATTTTTATTAAPRRVAAPTTRATTTATTATTTGTALAGTRATTGTPVGTRPATTATGGGVPRREIPTRPGMVRPGVGTGGIRGLLARSPATAARTTATQE